LVIWNVGSKGEVLPIVKTKNRVVFGA
jgi:hypothetical protein